MALRVVFRCLERPPTEGLTAQSTWCEPKGHTTEFCYSLFGGQWGTWHHLHVALDGPKEWVFRPFVDKQEQIGSKGRMRYTQHHMPQGAKTGSAWLCPNNSFKRVLSRGGAWENVQPGTKHPDEKDHDDEQVKQEPGAEAQREPEQVPGGSGEPAPGDGGNGQAVSESGEQPGTQNAGVALVTAEHPTTGEEPESVVDPESLEEVEKPAEGEGVDANGSPVV